MSSWSPLLNSDLSQFFWTACKIFKIFVSGERFSGHATYDTYSQHMQSDASSMIWCHRSDQIHVSWKVSRIWTRILQLCNSSYMSKLWVMIKHCNERFWLASIPSCHGILWSCTILHTRWCSESADAIISICYQLAMHARLPDCTRWLYSAELAI